MKRSILPILVGAVLALDAQSAVLYEEDFDSYADNTPLADVPGWDAGAGSGTLEIVDGSVVTGNTGETNTLSVYLADFGPELSDNYIGFTLTVAAGDGNRPTIAGLASGVDVNANRLLLGIRSWTGDPPTVNFVSNTAPNLLYNTTYRVVMQYIPGTAQNYWIGEPGTLSESSLYATSGAGGGVRDSFFFRDPGVFEIAFDDIVIATTFAEAAIPEPSTMGLVVLGAGGLFALRRRRAQGFLGAPPRNQARKRSAMAAS